MKKLLLIMLIVKQLLANDFIDITLKDYIQIVSKQQNVTIIIDDKIDKKFSLMISTQIKKKTYWDILGTLLKDKDLKLVLIKNHFYITSTVDDEKMIHKYKFKYVAYDDVKDIMTLYPHKYKFIKNLKTVFVEATETEFKKMLSIFRTVDKLPSQLKLKITILETDVGKLKEYGMENTLNLKQGGNENFFFNLLAFPFSVNNSLSTIQRNQFTTFVKYMDTNNYTKILSSPTLTIFDNKTSIFDIVKNIPYQTGKTVNSDDVTKTTTATEYKDIGLKLKIEPMINEDDVYLDIDLTSENILDTTDTPTISKRHINQFVTLKKGQVFILTGINQTETFTKTSATPILSDIPVLGWLFKSDSTENKTSNLTIMLEII